jgi:hypothetical protein
METGIKMHDGSVKHHLAIDENDQILKCWTKGIGATYIHDWKQLKEYDTNLPVSFRGMTGRKIVAECERTGRDYYYIDTGYLGNRQKRKVFHRVVKNGMQHSNFKNLPNDRWRELSGRARDFSYAFRGWTRSKNQGRNILLVTPSEKPCKFYGINRDDWVKETTELIKKYTDKEIIVRDKGLRHQRIGDGSIFNQFDEDKIFAVVTYNSIAATEAIMYGVPAFTTAPGAADMLCEKDLSKLETPKYSDPQLVQNWLHWLCYCQFTTDELVNGEAYRIIQEHDIR